MDSLTSWILTHLAFFASGLGILLIALSALLIILLWDWRVMLVGLMVVQIGIVVLSSSVYHFSLEWGSVQLLVTALSAAMLALSARQVQPILRMQRPGSWLVRLSAAILLVVSWQFVDLEFDLPLLTPQMTQLFLWLILCAVMLLGLGGSPFYTGVALLFWFMPIQAFLQILLPDHRLFVLIGIVEIFVSLACSYLLLAHRSPLQRGSAILTDLAFPEDQLLLPALPDANWSPRLDNELRRREAVTDLRHPLPPRSAVTRTSKSQPSVRHPAIQPMPATTPNGDRAANRPTEDQGVEDQGVEDQGAGEQVVGDHATGEQRPVQRPL